VFLSVPVIEHTCEGFLDENRAYLAASGFQVLRMAGPVPSLQERGEISMSGGVAVQLVGQPGIGSDLGPVELQLQAVVEINPQPIRFRFTQRVSHINTPNPPIT